MEKNKEEKRGRGERRERVPSISPLPHPLSFFAHISLHCPHNLNPWNRLLSHSLFPETTLAQFIIITSDFKIYYSGTSIQGTPSGPRKVSPE